MSEKGIRRITFVVLGQVSYLFVLQIYPFMSNVFSHPYQLDESISNFRVVGWYFSFYSNFKRNFCLQTVENLIRRRILWRLIWFCTVCGCPSKRTLGLFGVMSLLTEKRDGQLTLLFYFWADLYLGPSIQGLVTDR